MEHEYERPQADRTLLRLHLNENTAGCSPVVLEALRAVSPLDVSTYPDYDEVQSEAAAYFGVQESELLLVNGLDEGILAGALAARRRFAPAGPDSVPVGPASVPVGASRAP